MSLLDHPDAQALLADAAVTPEQVRGCQDRITTYLQRYLPRFYRAEQRAHATLVIRGLLSGLQRKTCEPIAVEAGVHRKPVQNFVGSGGWDDEAVMAELRGQVREVLADPQAILILDPSGFPKSGGESCGVARQWCGRLGKQDNCQLGVFLAYAAPGGYAPMGRRPSVPWGWASDGERGPLRVDAMAVRVRTKEQRRVGPEERLVVTRTVEAKPRVHYSLSNAGPEVPLSELVRVRFTRHRIEEVFGAAKAEVGLGQYEVRSWVGWHHHMTLSLLALWFLILERLRVVGENPGGDGVPSAGGLHPPAT